MELSVPTPIAERFLLALQYWLHLPPQVVKQDDARMFNSPINLFSHFTLLEVPPGLLLFVCGLLVGLFSARVLGWGKH